MKRFVLIFAMSILGSTVFAQDHKCPYLLDKLYYGYKSEVADLLRYQNIHVKELIMKGGRYLAHPKNPVILINKNAPPALKRVTLEHEKTHFYTDLKILRNPTTENIAQGVIISRNKIPIHPDLASYSHFFRIDETGASHDESLFSFSLARQIVEYQENRTSYDNLIVKWLLETAHSGSKDSQVFAKVTKVVVPGIISQIKRSEVIDFKTKKFRDEDGSSFYNAIIEVRAQDGGDTPLKVFFPLHETKIDPTDKIELNKKILTVLKATLSYADIYLEKAK